MQHAACNTARADAQAGVPLGPYMIKGAQLPTPTPTPTPTAPPTIAPTTATPSTEEMAGTYRAVSCRGSVGF
jgi:hypothetical protein